MPQRGGLSKPELRDGVGQGGGPLRPGGGPHELLDDLRPRARAQHAQQARRAGVPPPCAQASRLFIVQRLPPALQHCSCSP